MVSGFVQRRDRVLLFPFWHIHWSRYFGNLGRRQEPCLPAANCDINIAMHAKRLLILALFCCLPAISLAQQASPEATVLTLEKKWTDAYKLRDITLMTSMLADDFIITVE